MFYLEFDAPMSVQLSLFPEWCPPVSVDGSRCHRVPCPPELLPRWKAAAHHYVYCLGGTDEGFKRTFLLRYPIGPTTQDLEAFIYKVEEGRVRYLLAKSEEARIAEGAARTRATAEAEKQEKQNRWRRTGRSR